MRRKENTDNEKFDPSSIPESVYFLGLNISKKSNSICLKILRIGSVFNQLAPVCSQQAPQRLCIKNYQRKF